MAYTAFGIPTSAAMDITKEQKGLSHSHSSKDLCKQYSTMRRSYSDNHLCYSINTSKATSVKPRLKSSKSMGIFPLQLSGSILPNSLSSFLFDQETSKDMNVGDKGVHNIKENLVESSEEEIKNRANWVERLMEVKRHWRSKLPKERLDPDVMCNHDLNDECDCDEDDDNGCVVCYEEEGEEKEEGVQEVTYDSDSFSKFLVPVSRSDTKLYSQLAFLSNIAYVIPKIKVSTHGWIIHHLLAKFSDRTLDICFSSPFNFLHV